MNEQLVLFLDGYKVGFAGRLKSPAITQNNHGIPGKQHSGHSARLDDLARVTKRYLGTSCSPWSLRWLKRQWPCSLGGNLSNLANSRAIKESCIAFLDLIHQFVMPKSKDSFNYH